MQIAHVSLVEGDATNEDDPFSQRHIQQEVALCQRYFYKTYDLDVAPGTVTDAGVIGCNVFNGAFTYAPASYAVPMRDTPTAVVYNPSSGATGTARNINDNTNHSADINRENSINFLFAITDSGITNGKLLLGHVTADAEL